MEKQTEKVILRRLGVLSLAKVYAVLFAIFGLIMGIVVAITAVIAGSVVGFGWFGAGLGVLAIIVLPIMFALIGFIMGAVSAFLYNVVAGWVGGVEITFEQ